MRHEVQHMVSQKESERRIHLHSMHYLKRPQYAIDEKKVLSLNCGD